MVAERTPRNRAVLYEELRQKIGQDIRDVMMESGLHYEGLAAKLKVNKAELKRLIWDEDLRLSELVRILWKLDAQLYPIIRSIKKKGNNNGT